MSNKLRPAPDGYGYVRTLGERIYVAGQAASDRQVDPVAKTVACSHAAANEALLAVIDRAIADGVDFYQALCRTREDLGSGTVIGSEASGINAQERSAIDLP